MVAETETKPEVPESELTAPAPETALPPASDDAPAAAPENQDTAPAAEKPAEPVQEKAPVTPPRERTIAELEQAEEKGESLTPSDWRRLDQSRTARQKFDAERRAEAEAAIKAQESHFETRKEAAILRIQQAWDAGELTPSLFRALMEDEFRQTRSGAEQAIIGPYQRQQQQQLYNAYTLPADKGGLGLSHEAAVSRLAGVNPDAYFHEAWTIGKTVQATDVVSKKDYDKVVKELDALKVKNVEAKTDGTVSAAVGQASAGEGVVSYSTRRELEALFVAGKVSKNELRRGLSRTDLPY